MLNVLVSLSEISGNYSKNSLYHNGVADIPAKHNFRVQAIGISVKSEL